MMIEGSFSGSWFRKIEIQRGSLGSNEDDDDDADGSAESARRASELK